MITINQYTNELIHKLRYIYTETNQSSASFITSNHIASDTTTMKTSNNVRCFWANSVRYAYTHVQRRNNT